MQQIYMQSNEHFEVFTTVLSPQMCRARRRQSQEEGDKAVVMRTYQAHWPDEIDVSPGEIVHVFVRDEAWCYGRLQNGMIGYFPTVCLVPPPQSVNKVKSNPSLLRQASMQESSDPPCGCTGGRSLRLPRRAMSLSNPSGCPASPGLLQRMLKARRRSHGNAHFSGSENTAFSPD